MNAKNKLMEVKDYNPHAEIISRLNTIESQNIKIINRLDSLAPSGLMSRRDIQEECKVSLPTIHSEMKKGALKYIKIGRKTLFKREEVEKWIEKR